jgi:hypothetical protein
MFRINKSNRLKILLIDSDNKNLLALSKAFEDRADVVCQKVKAVHYFSPPRGIDAMFLTLMAAERWWWQLCRCLRLDDWLGSDAANNYGGDALNHFQALVQKLGVSMPQSDVILGGSSIVQSDCLADNKRHSLGFGFSY